MKASIKILTVLLVAVAMLTVSCKKAIKQPIGLGNEVDFSSPVLKLGQSWSGSMGGLIDVSINYDTATNTVYGTVKNISSRTLCWTLSEPHMKLGTVTVGELGPETLGDLAPGQQVTTRLNVLTDPKYTGYKFDGYLIHMEVYDCNGGIPLPYPNGI